MTLHPFKSIIHSSSPFYNLVEASPSQSVLLYLSGSLRIPQMRADISITKLQTERQIFFGIWNTHDGKRLHEETLFTLKVIPEVSVVKILYVNKSSSGMTRSDFTTWKVQNIDPVVRTFKFCPR
ncbi:hypothetical protein TNIN_460391 [Trichonephila inaurata madagascariensis]|uniref:Uncharacterized protein n=1 Tax=Trichonephila inaurata madagascariensis TaxID=2747483 RepID=A0A8X7CB93_9ARAC|nr:hypothetical protein TNIN_460391 [Trichonephila inaurata madagascariensis]